jgi:hypothetical protein
MPPRKRAVVDEGNANEPQPKRSKGKSFTDEEGGKLALSWVSVSRRAVGTDQKGTVFWANISEELQKDNPNPAAKEKGAPVPYRTADSCSNKFSEISREVNLWLSYDKKVRTTMQISGKSEEQIRDMIHQLFMGAEDNKTHSKFRWFSALEHLQKEPKWKGFVDAARGKTTADVTPTPGKKKAKEIEQITGGSAAQARARVAAAAAAVPREQANAKDRYFEASLTSKAEMAKSFSQLSQGYIMQFLPDDQKRILAEQFIQRQTLEHEVEVARLRRNLSDAVKPPNREGSIVLEHSPPGPPRSVSPGPSDDDYEPPSVNPSPSPVRLASPEMWSFNWEKNSFSHATDGEDSQLAAFVDSFLQNDHAARALSRATRESYRKVLEEKDEQAEQYAPALQLVYQAGKLETYNEL